ANSPPSTNERIPFCASISETISASALFLNDLSLTGSASLLSWTLVSGVSSDTRSMLQSGQAVMPARYSASQLGQNAIDFQGPRSNQPSGDSNDWLLSYYRRTASATVNQVVGQLRFRVQALACR